MTKTTEQIPMVPSGKNSLFNSVNQIARSLWNIYILENKCSSIKQIDVNIFFNFNRYTSLKE